MLPNGSVNTFAYGFDTNPSTSYTSFVNSSLTISFSADGTALFASDDQGIWQFKTTADLASSTSGTLVGLNDLRTLGVPYDGQNQRCCRGGHGRRRQGAFVPRPRRAGYRPLYWWPGQPRYGGRGHRDGGQPQVVPAELAGPGTNLIANTNDGHGTPVAGVIAQFVPQATIDPIDIFLPYNAGVSLTAGSTGGAGGTGGGDWRRLPAAAGGSPR